MSFKRLVLIGLTILAMIFSGASLFASWQKPQFQSRLELYQTNIVLQAQAWQPEDQSDENLIALQRAILGDNSLENASKQYQQAIDSVKNTLNQTEAQLEKLRSPQITTTTPTQPLLNDPIADQNPLQAQQEQIEKTISKLEKLQDELNLRWGILQTQQGDTAAALNTWSQVNTTSELTATANVLTGLWSNSPQLLPNAQTLITTNLEGWFRFTALSQLYQLQQRQDALSDIQTSQQATASDAILKLAIIAIIPSITAFIGVILLVGFIIQLLLKGRESILATNADKPWTTPWNADVIIQVFVLGFLLMGQVFIPEILSFIPLPKSSDNARIQAFSVLVSYTMVALGAFLVLYFSIKRYFPLPEDWFKFRLFSKWLLWGIGGYCTALPIVVIVSLVNQKLWQGQGGSNPLLQLVLESKDNIALLMFFFTAAIAAPFFEEFLFRGFLLPSLTRYVPVSVSILLSSLIFAIAHLSLSEILPLTALGMILGIVYTRSRNLLAPMLLHSLWNSGTLLSLFILGSSNN
ncbi:MAG: CPBP family intramembrane metalloprotease [Nostocales cyanobacterium]|nr:MAG: CPBP family intramembrane metalloprotease [Nostocales cyanobacterium]